MTDGTTGIPSVDVITAERLGREDGAGPRPLIVDVRELPEIVEARADGIAILPLSEFAARFRELPADRPLIIVCRSGNRSGMATGYLLAHGYPDVVNVAGGMLAWIRAGLPVRHGPLEPDEGRLPGS